MLPFEIKGESRRLVSDATKYSPEMYLSRLKSDLEAVGATDFRVDHTRLSFKTGMGLFRIRHLKAISSGQIDARMENDELIINYHLKFMYAITSLATILVVFSLLAIGIPDVIQSGFLSIVFLIAGLSYFLQIGFTLSIFKKCL